MSRPFAELAGQLGGDARLRDEHGGPHRRALLRDRFDHVAQGLPLVADDVTVLRDELMGPGVEVSDVDVQPWGSSIGFRDPDGNSWAVQQMPGP